MVNDYRIFGGFFFEDILFWFILIFILIFIFDFILIFILTFLVCSALGLAGFKSCDDEKEETGGYPRGAFNHKQDKHRKKRAGITLLHLNLSLRASTRN